MERSWKRTARDLHMEVLNREVERMLTQRFPVDRYPIDIQVIGGLQMYVTIHVSDGKNIGEMAKAVPEHYMERGGTVAAVLAESQRVISMLVDSGKLRVEEQWST